MQKECKICGIPKNLTEFPIARDRKDGYRAECKMCMIKYKKEYYQNHKKYLEERYKKDILYKIKLNLECRVRTNFKGNFPIRSYNEINWLFSSRI